MNPTTMPMSSQADWQCLFLPCAAGVEPLLLREISPWLPATLAALTGKGGVWVQAAENASPSLAEVMRVALRLNLHSRLAQRVLWQLAHGAYRVEDDIYTLAEQVDWPAWISHRQTMRVDVSAQRSPLPSLNFVALRVKDAVCDSLRRAVGQRPSVDTRRPDVALVLHLNADHAWLSVDLSGQPLFKRGWRDAKGGTTEVKGEAPLKETLAAAMIAASGWTGQDGVALLDPCCGAGTIAIEAAQMACGMAPGLNRRFAFERLLPFAGQERAWADEVDAARAAIHTPRAPVFAADIAFRLSDFARRNAQAAGVAHALTVHTGDALQRLPPADGGVMLLNPPYGERIAARGSLRRRQDVRPDTPAPAPREVASEAFAGGQNAATFFSLLAAHWKRHYPGWSAWVLTPELKLPTLMRLKESARVPMYNGAIECRLFRFDMVAGSLRRPPAGAADAP
ncbi:THUMP domain-containing class I SAM-dependent RNA methyltransferase [Amphibiibacter pelophylacis]|uniref:THUMP domain-containing protein n=1 Tax=Amphibiibacter pelophylacis TaxID=1799477 RepID=A0ACC6P343_9BURK